MDKLIYKWKSSKNGIGNPMFSSSQIIKFAREKRNKVLYFHYSTILVLSLTFISLVLFFYNVNYLNKILSKIGIGIMLLGLLLRIIIEIISIIKSGKIQFANDISKATSNAIGFFNFRNKIHMPVTLTIIAFYVIGFYLITPEINNYLATRWIILIDSCFALACVFLIWQIRKGIKKEMKHLADLITLYEAINF